MGDGLKRAKAAAEATQRPSEQKVEGGERLMQAPQPTTWYAERVKELEAALQAAREEKKLLRARGDEWRIKEDQAREEIRLVCRQLEAVDEALGPWESEPGSEVGAVGRVQTILNLKAAREETRRLREALEQVRVLLTEQDDAVHLIDDALSSPAPDRPEDEA